LDDDNDEDGQLHLSNDSKIGFIYNSSIYLEHKEKKMFLVKIRKNMMRPGGLRNGKFVILTPFKKINETT
jgi:hypothetical protein